MMTINSLYFFIKEGLSNSIKENQDLHPEKFHFDQNLDQKNYIRYDLPVSKNSFVEENQCFNLISHHLSFYEFTMNKNPRLSQYHYTAYFEDENQQKYQLHVYFDSNDQLTTDPVFSLETETNCFRKKNTSDELMAMLTQFAMDKSHKLIAELRQQFDSNVSSLEKKYNELEQQLTLLSIDMVHNHIAYQSSLNETISILSRLADYYPNSEYKESLTLFKRIQILIPTMNKKEKPFTNPTNDENNTSDKPIIKTKIIVTKDSFHDNTLSTLIQQAETAKNTFLSCEEDLHSRAELFLNFNNDACEVLAISTHEHLAIKPQNLQAIESLVSSKNIEGKKLLIDLLMHNQFEQAYNLRRFLIPIPDNLVKMALATGNAKLLDFLLTHGNFPINTFTVVDQLSPTLFCFVKDNSKFPKAGCLSVLIKHGASLFIPAHDGLPIAHHILSIPNHPLKKALIDNADLTLGKPHFYKTLIRLLENNLPGNILDDTQKTRILFSIEEYKASLTLVSGSCSATNTTTFIKNLEKVESLAKNFSSTDIEAVRTDKEVLAKTEEYIRLYKILSNKLSSTEKRRLALQGRSVLDNVNKIVETIGTNSVNLKQETLNVFDDSIRIITLRIELIDIQRILKTQKNIKQVKNANKRQLEIIAELKPLEEKYLYLRERELLLPRLTDKNLAAIKGVMDELHQEIESQQSLLAHLNVFNEINKVIQDINSPGDAFRALTELSKFESKTP